LRNTINRGIFESALSDDNFEFWYLNNGITIVCKECNYTPNSRAPKAELSNIQIVNGGQTTRTLFQANLKDPEKFDNVDVLLRIIETKDLSISEKIGETANRQTPVKSRDLRANDWVQRKLEAEFLTLGFYYQRKRNQHIDKPIEKRLDSEELGQVYLAYYLDMPAEAKDQKTIIFGDKYGEIFDEEAITAERLLVPMRLYRPLAERKAEIQRRKRKKEPVSDEDAFVSLATFHILNGMKLVAEQAPYDLEDETDVVSAQTDTITLIGEIVALERVEQGELYTHDRFFKRKTTSQTIQGHILKQYEG
jgi:hypothetical protein